MSESNGGNGVFLVPHRKWYGEDCPAHLVDLAAVIYVLQNSLETILQPPILINLLHGLGKMAVAAGTKVRHLSKQRPMKTKSNLNKAASFNKL